MNDSLLMVAIQAALRAGEILRQGYGAQIDVTYKPGIYNLVTQFDNAAEKEIINLIQNHFPGHEILAEESGYCKVKNAPVLWVIDPLDGTTNFAHHIPLFAVSIGVMVDNDVKLGVIYLPIIQELFVAVKGKGAFGNGTRLQVSKRNNFLKAVGTTGFPHDIGQETSHYMKRLCTIAGKGNPIRDLGSAAVNLAYLAAGRIDYYWIDSLQTWDVAAGKLLIEEAGGKVTHYDGSTHTLENDTNLLATNGLLHNDLLRCLGTQSI